MGETTADIKITECLVAYAFAGRSKEEQIFILY